MSFYMPGFKRVRCSYQEGAFGSIVSWLFMLMVLAQAVQAQSPPTLVFPKNNIVTGNVNIIFEWNAVPGAASYDLQYDTTAGFNSIPHNVPSTTFAATLQTGKKYFWRVRAATTGYSPAWSFHVFSPPDVPRSSQTVPNLVTWYKADSGVRIDSNGLVFKWDDASGNGNHAVQGVEALRPVFVASEPVINGYPLIHFQGFNQYLDFTIKLRSVETVFWVVMEDPNATLQYRSLLGDWDDEPDFVRGCCEDNNGNPSFPGSVKFIYDDYYPVANDYVKDGTTRVNGTIVLPTLTNMPTTMSIISTRTAGNCQAENFVNDRNLDSGKRVWHGNLAELIIFNDPLTNAQIALVEGYLHDKYAPAVNLGADISIPHLCDTVTLSVGRYYKSVKWWNGKTSDTVHVSSPGTYWVEAKDQFDRTTYDTIVVQFVRPDIIRADTICFGESIIWNTGLGAPFTFQWQDGSTNPSYTIDKSGDYYVTVSDGTGCSFTSDVVHIKVDSFNVTASLGPDTTICQYQSIGLVSGADQAASYSWSTGENTPQIVIAADGNYSLTVSNAIGCMAVDTIFADVGPEAPAVDFSVAAVCLGFPTNFIDNSSIGSGNTLISWHWDFGDNSSVTAMAPNQNQSHTYQAPGIYTVKLTVTAGNLCTNSKVKAAEVFSLPRAFFTDSVFCAAVARQVIDRSTPALSLANWQWDFGDGTTVSLQHPVHRYDSLGTYSVSLIVTDNHFCADTFSRTVTAVPGVPDAETPALILPKNDVTLAEPSVLFDWDVSGYAEYYRLQIATDPLFANLVYALDVFADSARVSNLPLSEAYYYWQVMAYNLCGTATPSVIQRFHLFSPDVIAGNCLWLRSDRGVLTDISGAVETVLDNSSSGNHASQSDVGRRPAIVHNIRELNSLPVLQFDGRNDFLQFQRISAIRTVFWVVKEDEGVTPFYRSLLGRLDAQPDFTRGCCDDGYPGSVRYIYDETFASSRVVSGTTRLNGNVIYPTQTDMPTQYSIISTRTTGNTTSDCFGCDRPFIYPNDQRYWDGDLAELIIYCEPLSDTQIEVVESYLRTKYAPPVNLGPDITRGYDLCVPVVLRAGKHFVHYDWDVPGMTVSHTSDTVRFFGSGKVKVCARDVFGFTSCDEIVVSGGLENPFDDTVFVCLGNDTVWDTKMSHAHYTFLWDDFSTDSFHVLNQEKLYSVTVTDKTVNHCAVSDTIFVNIDSFSVQASLGSGDTALCSGNRISLITKADEAVSYTWSNGDSMPVTVVTTPAVYSLTAENFHGCVVYDSMNVEIYGDAPDAAFSFSRVCDNDTTQFNDETPDMDIVWWQWDFGDSATDTVRHPAHFYSDTGAYAVKLTVMDSERCLQSISREVFIYALPVTGFTHDLINCANGDVRFDDTSTAVKQAIARWAWTFGDGGTGSAGTVIHKYADKGFYAVSLTVTTDQGCMGTAYDTMEIFPELVAGFRAENLCIQSSARFFDTSPNSNILWYWEFGDGSYSFQKNPTHSYLQAGTYVVTMKVTNALDCEKTVADTITITSPPVVNFAIADICEDFSYRFTDNTVTNGGDAVVKWRWNFGDGTPESAAQNPAHAYSTGGAYNVRLSVVTRNGCESSHTKAINVFTRPVANFEFTPQYGAAPLSVSFNNLSVNATAYTWIFGDGSPISRQANPVHEYLQNGSYGITLIASSLPGCSDIATQSISVAVPLFDIGIDKIFLSQQTDNRNCLLDVKAIITNYGTVDITSFNIRTRSSEGGTVEDRWEGSLPAGHGFTYALDVQFVLNECSNVLICMEASDPNGQPDQNPLNNRLCTTFSNEFMVIGPYPNPAGDFVNLDILLPSKGSLKITNHNAIGQRLSMTEMAQAAQGHHPIVMETRHLPAGVYILVINYNDHETVFKFAVRH